MGDKEIRAQGRPRRPPLQLFEKLIVYDSLFGPKDVEHAFEPEESGPEGGAHDGFEDLIVGVVSLMEFGDVVVIERKRVLGDSSRKNSQRAGEVRTLTDGMPDVRC